MAGQKKVFTGLLLAIAFAASTLIEVTMATNYTVGAPGGSWDLVTDLNTWASLNNFYVGDYLFFLYTSSHSVLQVTEADYVSCDTSNPIGSDNSGYTSVSLTSSGRRFFICGGYGHCSTYGMKVEIYTFYTSTYYSPPPPPPPTEESPLPPPPPPSSVPDRLGVGIIVAGVLIVLVLLCLLCFCTRMNRERDRSNNDPMPPPPTDGSYGAPPAESANMVLNPSAPPANPSFTASSGGSGSSNPPLTPLSPGISLGFSLSVFTYEELAMATNDFSDANFLGRGGFGYVHRGVLPNGQEVAVKQLKAGSGQGDREFLAEVEIISRVHHKHLVSLVGYCMTGSNRLLVYELVPNNTLKFHLHGKGRPLMDWPSRMRVALGSAKGLAYLHEDCHPKIIHRDIKAANILIDFNFDAKVADFGLAKPFSGLETHVSTRIMGTFGYLAPEYAASGKLTEKSDVFSFGVMLLELITGRRPASSVNMDDTLVDWARPLLTRALEEGNFSELVDERLKTNYNHDEMLRMVSCAEASLRQSARRRPRMSQIVGALGGNMFLSNLNEGVTTRT